MVRSIVRAVVFILLSGAILFGISGNWYWRSAWIYLAVLFGTGFLSILILPAELRDERSKKQAGAKRWDVAIVILSMLIGFAVLAAAALDVRYSWSGRVPPLVKGMALAAYIAAMLFVLWAMRSNRFFVRFVRIQTERGHVPITAGPYAYIRHPGYVGILVNYVAVPLLLGSLLALKVALAGALLLIVRTALEDRTLQHELPGYTGYAATVRYRLLPGIW